MTKSLESPNKPAKVHEPKEAPLTASRGLLLAAWILLAIWIVLLGALALHVIGLW